MRDEIIDILVRERVNKKLSQNDIAIAIGKSKRTVQNWEAGVGSPTIEDVVKWVDAVGIDLTRFAIAVKHGKQAIEVGEKTDDKKAYIHRFIDDFMTDNEVDILCFLLSGNTGSAIYSYFQKIAADLACPIHDRVSTGLAIYNNYEVAEALGNVNKAAPKVDKMVFESALGSGKEAAKKGKNSYTEFE